MGCVRVRSVDYSPIPASTGARESVSLGAVDREGRTGPVDTFDGKLLIKDVFPFIKLLTLHCSCERKHMRDTVGTHARENGGTTGVLGRKTHLVELDYFFATVQQTNEPAITAVRRGRRR